MTRDEHIAECRWCRASVNCIEWYRQGLTGCWCSACGIDHWVTWEGEPHSLDVVTITWWSSWGMTPPTRVALSAHSMSPQLRGRTEHAYVRETVLDSAAEGTTWIRGAFPEGAPELDALLAAKALAT